MPIYEIPLPNGTILEIEGEAGREREAQARARQYFQQAFPQEFEEWRRTQVGFGRSLTQGASRAIDEFQGQLYSAAEGLGQSLNLPSLQGFGREGRIRNAIEAEAAQPEALRTDILSARGVGDVGRAAAEIVTGSLPQTGTALGGALTGARLGAAFGVPGAVIGGLLGGAAAGFLPTAGSNIQRQVQVEAERQGVPEAEITQIPSPGAAFGAAVPQAALESGADVLTLGAARFLGRPVREAAGSLGQRVARGAGVGAATEAVVEPLQTGIERYQADLPVNPFTNQEAAREYLQAGLGGAIAGGVLGGAARGAFGARPAPPVQPEVAAAETPAAAAPAAEAAPIPEAPSPAAEAAPPSAPVAEAEAAPTPEAAPSPAPITGFATERGTYQVNEQGLTSRVETTPEGQQVTTPPATALYISPENARIVQAATEQGFDYRVVSMTPEGPREVTPGQAIAGSDNFILLTNNEGQVESVIQPQSEPAVGLVPLELQANEQGEVVRTLGDPITEIQQAAPEPVQEAPAPEAAPTPEAAPAPQITPEQEQDLWRGYSLNAGPAARNPIVQAARDVANQRQRPFTRPEFTEFANEIAGAPTPDAQQAIVQNYSTLRQAPSAGQVPPSEAVGAPRGTPQMSEPERQQIKDQIDEPLIGSVLNFFASPVLTLTRLSRAFAPVRTAFMQFTALDNFYKTSAAASHKSLGSLNDASKRKVILGLDKARRERKEINQADYTAEELNAIRDFRSHMNFIYDNAIEAVARPYFDPTLTTDPAQRAERQALKDKYTGKFLTEIPAAELTAVSPEGGALVQKYKASRDPFFFPQRTSGSHFVAAYERLPDGKKKLVALYGYTPLYSWQRRRGFENPEAVAIRKLREEFPNADTHYVMTSGVKFKNDDQAFNLKRDGDFINRYLESLRDASGKEGREIIDRMSAEIKKANIDSLFKPYNGILRAVTPENAVEYATNYLPAYYLTAGRLNARLYSQEDFDRAFKPLRPENRELFEGVLANGTAPTEAYGTAQTFVFFQYLGFALDTAAVSAMQIPTAVAPRLGRDGGVGRGTKYLTEAMNDSLFDKAIFNVLKSDQAYAKAIADKQVRKDEADALRRAIQRGVFIPTSAFRMQGSVSAADIRTAGIADKDAVKFANGVNTVVDLAGRPLAAIEEFGRSSTFMAAYRMARDNPSVIEQSNRYDNTNYKNAEDYAAGVVFDTWYTGSKLDDPGFLRQFPVLNLATQFMRPVFKFTETVLRDATKTLKALAARDLTMARIGAISVFGSLAPLVLIGGIWALPFADLSRELLERMLKTFFDNPLDLRLELDRAMGGGYLGEAANFGLLSASNIANLSKRVAVDPIPSDTLFSWSTLALLGPGGDLLQRIPKTYEHWKRGEYWEAAASFPFTPRVAGNAIKGAQLEVDREQFTQAGTRFLTPELLERVDSRLVVPASARQALGFPAPELANERELWRRQKVIEDATKEASKSINMELSRMYLRVLEAQRNGNMDEAYRQINALQARLQEFVVEQQSKPEHLRVRPDMNSVRDRARQDLLGRSSTEVLLEETRRQARPTMLPIIEEMRWRDRGFAEGGMVQEERFSVRQPYESELEFFEKNPGVSGMATEDNRVILNPYSDLSEQEREAVVLNERARLAIRNGAVEPPNFILTPEQMAYFSRINKGRPYGNPQDIKETLAARILSGDPSAQKPTRAQLEYVDQLRQALGQPN